MEDFGTHTLADAPPQQQVSASLRVLATTDLHMHLLDHDYISNTASPGKGLAGIATLIARARADAARKGTASILLDNGDMLQGTPLADWAATRPVDAQHPLVQCFNHLGYNAVGLGNHDLDHGIGYLRDVAGCLDMPVVSSNLVLKDPGPICQDHMITVPLPGSSDTVNVAVLSVLPPETALWNRDHLRGHGRIDAPATAIAARIPSLRAKGADVVVVLAHMGVGLQDGIGPGRSAAQEVAAIAGVDLLIVGHTHQRLPGPDYHNRRGVDAINGMIGTVPAIMAGHEGSDLAQIDLQLEKSRTGQWVVRSHQCALIENGASVQPCPALLRLLDAPHKSVIDRLEIPVTSIDRGVHSYFAMLRPSAPAAILAAAKRHAVAAALRDRGLADVPVLVAAPNFSTGGRGGPQNYIHIPPGPVRRRHFSGIDPYSNSVWVAQLSGADLRRWLERAARVYHTRDAEDPLQMLIDPAIPSFEFDTLFGLTYAIDPAAAPSAKPSRIRDLCHQGKPVDPDQKFVVVTNQFRAAGGGGYPRIPVEKILLRGSRLREEDMLAGFQDIGVSEGTPWRLCRTQKRTAVYETSPNALDHLDEIAEFQPEPLGICDRGFLRLRITL